MKKTMIQFLFLFCMVGISFSCNKDCEEANSSACNVVPPTNENCQAAFLNWFYNSETKSCEQIGYSGCSDVGFKTREDCEICLCN